MVSNVANSISILNGFDYDIINVYCVYTIFNKHNGKVYVGKTNDYVHRIKAHIATANYRTKNKRCLIHLALRKYGSRNFIFTVLQQFITNIDCLAAEKYWIRYFRANEREFGYNLTEGGEGSCGFYQSDEAKRKVSRANTGKIRTQEWKDKKSEQMQGEKNHFYGKTHAPEIKQLLSVVNSIRQQGKNNSFFGKTHTIESKTQMSLSHLGNQISEENRQLFSVMYTGAGNPFYGKTHTEEFKETKRGENSNFAKLKEWEVLEIKDLLKNTDLTHKNIADRYNVSRSHIGSIANGKVWSHLKEKK